MLQILLGRNLIMIDHKIIASSWNGLDKDSIGSRERDGLPEGQDLLARLQLEREALE